MLIDPQPLPPSALQRQDQFRNSFIASAFSTAPLWFHPDGTEVKFTFVHDRWPDGTKAVPIRLTSTHAMPARARNSASVEISIPNQKRELAFLVGSLLDSSHRMEATLLVTRFDVASAIARFLETAFAQARPSLVTTCRLGEAVEDPIQLLGRACGHSCRSPPMLSTGRSSARAPTAGGTIASRSWDFATGQRMAQTIDPRGSPGHRHGGQPRGRPAADWNPAETRPGCRTRLASSASGLTQWREP